MVVDNDIPLPGTNQSVNPSNPAETVMTLTLLAVGAGVAFFAIFDAGAEVRGALGGFVARLTGIDMGEQSSGIEIE